MFLKWELEVLIKFQSSYLIVVLEFLNHQVLVSLLNHQDSELGYIQNLNCILHFLLSQIYVPLKNNTTDYLQIENLLDNIFLVSLI